MLKKFKISPDKIKDNFIGNEKSYVRKIIYFEVSRIA